MKIGEIRKFSFGTYLIEDEIQTEDFKYIEQCSKSGKEFHYNIIKIFILKNPRLPKSFIGISEKGHILRLPADKIQEIIKS